MNIKTILPKSIPAGQANSNGVYPEGKPAAAEPAAERTPPPDQETLRRYGWEVGERKPAEQYQPAHNHVGLAMISPGQGFAHWRIRQQWIDDTAWSRGQRWFHCRLVLRLYDVSFIEFTGLNANALRDVDLPGIAGQTFFTLGRPGTWQVGEVGFLLRNGEFVPAARSHVVQFASDSVSPRHDHAALLVDDHLGIEEVGNLWEQDRVLQERRKPKLRQALRLAAFTFEAPACGQQSLVARFAAELAGQQAAQGHQVYLFVPACPQLQKPAIIDGVSYQPLEVRPDGSAIEKALSFAHAAESVLNELPPFDLLHVHEWMAGQAPWVGSHPTVLSLTSLESVRLGGKEPNELARDIQKLERELAHAVDVILTPDWMRGRAIGEFGLDASLVQAFPMEAKLPDEWECPLDFGHVKMSIGFGPLDQLLLFVGPLEHAAGPDLLIEALPTLLGRCPGTRVAFCGTGGMHGHLEWLANSRGVGHAVRVLGHVQHATVVKLMRSADALALPSRYRVPHDDAVIDLARRAGRPVVTTHSGPAYLVKHEETGVITYDNPNSMVWALERVLRDTGHAARMGQAGKRSEGSSVSWGEVARRYLELCAQLFPELVETRS